MTLKKIMTLAVMFFYLVTSNISFQKRFPILLSILYFRNWATSSKTFANKRKEQKFLGEAVQH